MKRVLVTGASGFVGRHTPAHLSALGYEVHSVSRDNVVSPSVAKHHRADLHRADDVNRLLREIRPTHLLHLAWHVPPNDYWTSAENMRWVESSLALLRGFAEQGGQRWVGTGTCAEYDWTEQAPFTALRTRLYPASFYGVCKHALQWMQTEFGRQQKISTAWGRLFFLYGPSEPAGRLIPSVITAALRGKEIACTSGRQRRDYLFVDDAARALATLLDSAHEGPMNIASGLSVSVAALAQMAAEAAGGAKLLRLGAIPDRPDEPREIVADIAPLRRLGFSPSLSLDRGLRDSVTYWREALAARR